MDPAFKAVTVLSPDCSLPAVVPRRVPLDVSDRCARQVAYKQGMNPLKDWTMAADEAHSTKCVIKGLKEGEKYFVKVKRRWRLACVGGGGEEHCSSECRVSLPYCAVLITFLWVL